MFRSGASMLSTAMEQYPSNRVDIFVVQIATTAHLLHPEQYLFGFYLSILIKHGNIRIAPMMQCIQGSLDFVQIYRTYGAGFV